MDSHQAQLQDLQRAVHEAARAKREVSCVMGRLDDTNPTQALLATHAMQQAAQHYRQVLDGKTEAAAGSHPALAPMRARLAALAQVCNMVGCLLHSACQVIDTLAERVQGTEAMDCVLVARAHLSAPCFLHTAVGC